MKSKQNILMHNYLLCMVAYSLASDFNQAVGGALSKGGISSEILRLSIMIVPAYAIMILCGLMMALLVKRKVLLHASMATMFGVALHINFITEIAAGDYIRVLLMLAFGAVLGGTGGLASAIISRLRNRRS